MRAEGHRKAEEDIERSIAKLEPDLNPDVGRLAIEGAWGGAFQWSAFGCETRYHQHQNNHTRLGRFLRNFSEGTAANWWEALDALRQGGWYGGEPDAIEMHRALDLLANIRA